MDDRQRRHEIARRHRFYRKWHRWIGIVASLFLIFAAVTGFLVAFTEFFGPAERMREENRTLTSQVNATTDWSPQLKRALDVVPKGAPIVRVEVDFRGQLSYFRIVTGKHGGGEDKQYDVDFRTGKLRKVEDYADKPFLYRLHSGEAFGDGGLVMAMAWGLALAILGLSGVYIWFSMRKRVVAET